VWLAALIPFHVIYPRLLMTENLFLTLFLCSIGFVILDLGNITRRQSLLVGAVWGATYLTRFIFLPVIPLLGVLWWFQPVIVGNQRVWADAKLRLSSLGWTALGVCAFAVPWYLLSHPIKTVSETASPVANAPQGVGDLWVARTLTTWNGALVLWLVLYLAYLILMSGPFLPVMTLLPLTIRRMASRARFFTLVCIGVTGTLLLVSVNYMATLSGNWANAVMEGRYLMPILPLVPILAFVVLESAVQVFARVKRAWLLVELVIAGLLASAGYYVEILRGVIPLPVWFSNLPWVAPDTTAFNEMAIGPLGIGFFGFGLILMAVGFAWVAWRPRQWVWAVAVAATFFYVADSAYTGEQTAIAQAQSIPGQSLASLKPPSSQTQVALVVLDAGVPVDPQDLSFSMAFWGIPLNSYLVLPAKSLVDQLAQDPGYAISQTEYPNPLKHYTLEGKTYGIYAWPINLSGPPMVIKQFGPTETVAGQGFNTQPNGDSAMWIMTDNLSPGVILVFGDKDLPTVAGDANVVTAAIPQKLLAQPRIIQVWLRDPITRRTSNVVQFVVK
jgi:hypothetical protein